MERRESLRLLAALGLGMPAAGSLAGSGLAGFQDNFVAEIIRGNVGRFQARGGTIGWMASEGGFVVIDSQFPEQASLLIDYLRENNEKPFRFLFNTHHHGDHSGGNIAFKGLVSEVVAHENSKANQERVANNRENSPEQLYPGTTFTTEWSGKHDNEVITATWFAEAHTNGDSVIHFENANIAHVGDLVFNRRHPYIDQSSGANINSWIRVLNSIRKKYDNDTIFICGHAGGDHDTLIKGDDIAVAANYFESLLDTVSRDLKEGRSREEILARKSLPGVDWEGNGLERSLTAAYNELSGE